MELPDSQTPKAGSHQPELGEEPLADARLRDLSRQDALAIGRRSVARVRQENVTDAAAALAYYFFLSLPGVLLLSLGFLGVLAGRSLVERIMGRVESVAPPEAIQLLSESLHRVVDDQAGVLP